MRDGLPLVLFGSQIPGTPEQVFPSEEEMQAFGHARATDGFILTPPGWPPGAVRVNPLLSGADAYAQMVFMTETSAEFTLTPDMRRRVLDRFDVLYERLEPDVIVLGSFLTSVMDQGRAFAEHVDMRGWKTIVTTGDAGSAQVVYQLMRRLLRDNRESCIGIVGLGLIGTGILRMLIADGHRKVIVVGRNAEKLRRAVAEIDARQTEVVATTDMWRLGEAHMVATLTASTQAVLHPEFFPAPVLALDPAVPPNIAYDARWAAGGHVVLTDVGQLDIGLGTLSIPSRTWGSWGPHTLFSCLGEGLAEVLTMAHAPGWWDGWGRSHFVGDVNPLLALWFDEQCHRLGWHHTMPLHMWDRPVPLETAQAILDERLALSVPEVPMSIEHILATEG